MNTTEIFLIAMVIIFAVPYLVWRLAKTEYYAPLVVVQIIAGILLGPGVLGAIFPEYYAFVFTAPVVQSLNGIAWWAVMIFVWIAGIELDLGAAWKHRKETAITAGLALGTPLAMGCIAALIIVGQAGWIGDAAHPWQFVLGIGMACAVTALPILILFMEKLEILRQPIGQRILRYASMDDIAIWGVLALILMDWTRIGRQLAFLAAFALAAYLFRRLMRRIPEEDRWYAGLIWLAVCGLGADWCGLHYMVGAFLSGGIDSSTIVALMQATASRPVKTFTIGFDVAGYDEAAHAKAVASYLGTDHTELYVTSSEARDVIPALPRIYDEPFADSSQIPSTLISRLARQHVTVSLSGDGGDELFGGYNRYAFAEDVWPSMKKLPTVLRRTGATAISAIRPEFWDGFVAPVMRSLRWSGGQPDLANKLAKVVSALRAERIEDAYLDLVSHWTNPSSTVIGGQEPATTITAPPDLLNRLSDTERMMALDMMDYLPSDVLTKLDRAAMSASLETRAPFLDHNVVEFAWRLPLSSKLRKGVTKWPLREVLYRYVPRALVDRPKVGFGVPLDNWLRGPLRDWASHLLDERRLADEGYFLPHEIVAKWKAHLAGNGNWGHHLWDILMFQQWLEVRKQG